MATEIALAASTREWPDRLHRFLLDHGGGRVVDRVMGSDQALSTNFDVLLIDDVCSFLAPWLVSKVKGQGSEVIGVFDSRDGADAKRRLLECGISDVIESDASPEEILAKVATALEHRVESPRFRDEAKRPLSVGVTGPTEGVGMTETAVALALSIADRVSTVLVDIDQEWPSIAQRLGLSLHPNIRTAIDHAQHDHSRVPESLHHVGTLKVVGGRADQGNGLLIGRQDVLVLLEAMHPHAEVVVADLGPFGSLSEGLGREFDTLIVVGGPSPVGIARLLRTVRAAVSSCGDTPILAVVNQVGGGAFRRSEIMAELNAAFPGLSCVFLPADPRIVESAWNGKVDFGRRYARSLSLVSDVLVGSVG